MQFSKKQIIILAIGGFLGVVVLVLVLMNIKGGGDNVMRGKLIVGAWMIQKFLIKLSMDTRKRSRA